MSKGMTEQKNYSNSEMANMLFTLERYVEIATGKFGYAVARNTRKLNDACFEFLQERRRLFSEFGTDERDENGNPTGNVVINMGTDAYTEFLNRLGEYSDIEHSVEIYKVPYDILPDSLTAKDLLALDWMLYDADDL